MFAKLVESMGSDLSVVNSARVSFDKRSEWEYRCNADCREHGHLPDSECFGCEVNGLSDRDSKLIKYLATHNHTSPFRHCFATFHVKAPIFVARQLAKSQVGMSWNEVSRRYVDSEPEFWWPDKWRKRAEDKKQGSGEALSDDLFVNTQANLAIDGALHSYNAMLKEGVAPEQARIVLPQNMYTEWYWSGSLQAWAHMCNLRCYPDAQAETREVADHIDRECEKLWPVSWKALRKEN